MRGVRARQNQHHGGAKSSEKAQQKQHTGTSEEAPPPTPVKADTLTRIIARLTRATPEELALVEKTIITMIGD